MNHAKILCLSIFAALVTSGVVGCVSGGMKTSGSIVDGTWNETSIGCIDSPPSQHEEIINSALKSGQVSVEMQISGGKALTKIKTWVSKDHSSGEGRGYCQIDLDQRWDVISNHVEVTDLDVHQQGHDGNKCSGKLEIHDPRVHNFKLDGDRLTVFMNSTIAMNPVDHMTSIRPSQCANGQPQVVIFDRAR
jgi:hypothetical protein